MSKEKESVFVGENSICFYDDYPEPLMVQGIQYPSIRHAVLSLKTESPEIKRKIASTLFASDLKELSDTIPDPPYWNVTFVMEWLELFTYRKFIENPDLEQRLLDTHDRTLLKVVLSEANNYLIYPPGLEMGWQAKILTEVRKKLSFKKTLFL